VIEISRILCPIDFSEYSRHALQHAFAIAGWYGSHLTVLFVSVNVPTMDLPPMPLSDKEREDFLSRMRSFAGSTPAEVQVNFVVREATDVRRAILEQADTLMADLLVIGSHGRSGFERFLLGSVTETVARKAPCPVMVVPAHANGDRRGLVHGGKPRMLCAVDFSDASLGALEFALSLAEESDADLTLLHSIEVPPELLEHIPVPPDFNVDQVHAAARAGSLQRLRDLVPEPARTYCHVETTVGEGAAYRRILQTAEEQRADLIVMGVHGRGGVELLLFGSNTARVIRAAHCPVLIVPPRKST
jgi:nucleotide-binding universal stress UspA family protein